MKPARSSMIAMLRSASAVSIGAALGIAPFMAGPAALARTVRERSPVPAVRHMEAYSLVLERLFCRETQDAAADEAYILVDGVNVWHGDINNNETRDLEGPVGSLGAGGRDSSIIELWEDDGDHWYDRNDLLGRFTIKYDAASVGEHAVNLTGEGANYDLIYRITAS